MIGQERQPPPSPAALAYACAVASDCQISLIERFPFGAACAARQPLKTGAGDIFGCAAQQHAGVAESPHPQQQQATYHRERDVKTFTVYTLSR